MSLHHTSVAEHAQGGRDLHVAARMSLAESEISLGRSPQNGARAVTSFPRPSRVAALQHEACQAARAHARLRVSIRARGRRPPARGLPSRRAPPAGDAGSGHCAAGARRHMLRGGGGTFDVSMEDGVVVVVARGEREEVFAGLGRPVAVELQLDVPQGRVQRHRHPAGRPRGVLRPGSQPAPATPLQQPAGASLSSSTTALPTNIWIGYRQGYRSTLGAKSNKRCE